MADRLNVFVAGKTLAAHVVGDLLWAGVDWQLEIIGEADPGEFGPSLPHAVSSHRHPRRNCCRYVCLQYRSQPTATTKNLTPYGMERIRMTAQPQHDSKAKLLDAALQMIRAKGYAATTVEERSQQGRDFYG